MKYIINYYHKVDGVWRLNVKTTENIETLTNLLHLLHPMTNYKLYSVTTDWSTNDHLA